MLVRAEAEVSHHLHGLCILHFDVLFLDHALHKKLMDDLAETSPHISIVHDEQMIATGDDVVANERRGAIAVDGALLVY
jgi:hypothetical protein